MSGGHKHVARQSIAMAKIRAKDGVKRGLLRKMPDHERSALTRLPIVTIQKRSDLDGV